MEISSSFNNIQNNKVTSDKNKEAKKNPNPAPLNKDTVSFSGKAKEAAGKTGEENAKEYFDFDFSKIKEIETEAQLTLQDGTTIPLKEYINQILSQDTGFETEEEYRQYILDNFSSNLKMMKQAFQEQQESNGIVSKAYDKLKELTGFGISSEDVEKMITEQEEMLNALTGANNQSQILFEKIYEQYTGTKYSKEQFDEYLKISNVYSAIMTGCRNDKDFAKNVKKVTGKSVKKLSKEFALAQLDTFGKTASLKIDAEKYAQDKETFKDKLSAIITTTGMGSIVIGAVLSFIFPPAAAAGVGLMMAGKSLSLGGMFVDNVMDLADSATDKDGLTKEELGNLALETGFEAVSYGTGRAIGKFTNGLNNIVTNKALNAGMTYAGSHIAGQAAETGVDAAMSLTADYVLAQGQSYITTGQFMKAEDYWSLDRFLTEGRNQLMGILTGVASSKINAFQQGVITTAQAKILEGDTEGAKEHLKKSGIKMTDANFEQFVLSVKEAEAVKSKAEIKTEESDQTRTDTTQEDTQRLDIDIKQAFPNVALNKFNIELAKKILSDERLIGNPDFMKYAGEIIRYTDTKERAELTNRILSDERLFNNPDFMQEAVRIVYDADTEKRAEAKIALLDKILSNERLIGNPDFMKKAGSIIDRTNTKEIAEARIAIFDKISSDERLYNNPEFMTYNVVRIIISTITKEKAEIANRILSDERLFNNPYFMQEASRIIDSTDTKEIAEARIAIFDKISSDERLYNNPEFMTYNVVRIIISTITKEKAEAKTALFDKILSDERFYNNPDFMKYAGEIIRYTDTKEQAEIKTTMLDKILSDERFYNNPVFMENAGNIISSTITKEQAEIKTTMLDKILSDERFYNNPVFMKYAGGIIGNANTKEQADLANYILSDERFYNNPDFMKYAGEIIRYTDTKERAELTNRILSDERLFNNPDFMKYAGGIIGNADTKEKAEKVLNLLNNYERMEILPNQILFMLNEAENNISISQLKKVNRVLGKQAGRLSASDTVIAASFTDLYGKNNINEIPIYKKRELLRKLVAANSDLFQQSEDIQKLFPLLPKNQEEYCALLPSIVKSLGIETNSLTSGEVKAFEASMSDLSSTLKGISDSSFKDLTITQEYPKDAFIKDILDKVKDLSPSERQKVYDYFGFELHKNTRTNTGFYITGYPVNLNNGKKLAQITDPETKEVVEAVRSDVIRFSENNPVICSDKNIEQELNSIVKYLPEMRTMIDRVQAGNDTLKDKGAHSYDVLKHSLKVMQKVSQDEKFESLNVSDKKLMLIASLMHDITKKEGYTDKTHYTEGAFDMFFISQKFNLSREEQIKLYTLIKHHEWLSYVNKAKSQAELEERLQSTAYDLRHDNILDMSLMFSHADLRAVKEDDSFHDKKEGDSRIDFNGEVRSFGEACDLYGEKLKEYISELQKSQPILPVTKIPSADIIKQNLTVNPDGSTNVKGVYVDKDGLVVIKFNEVEDWEKIGFPKGSVSRGITQTMYNREQVDTGNIKFIVHGLDYANQLTKFDAFSLIDSDVLLSVSYAERPESKYRFFRPQGVLLDVDTKDIHGGGDTDAGSGLGKNIDTFKQNYIFGGERESDRLYISELVKNALNLSDEEYIDFVRKNANKSFIEIEPAEVREKLIKAFASINSNTRKGNREYNEMYISNPKSPMAVFAYSIDYNEKIDDPLSFLNRDEVKEHERGFGNINDDISVKNRTAFLRQYALEHNIPFFIFGD